VAPRGAKARTTKAKGRIDEAGRLIRRAGGPRPAPAKSSANIDFDGSGRRTKRLIECKGAHEIVRRQVLFRDLDLTLTPGTRLASWAATAPARRP